MDKAHFAMAAVLSDVIVLFHSNTRNTHYIKAYFMAYYMLHNVIQINRLMPKLLKNRSENWFFS